MSTLDVKALSIAFQTKAEPIVAVDAIDFYLEAGETVALVGESGCGKSLTALAMMRLLPLHARYGAESQIAWANQDVLNLSERKMRRLRGKQFGMIFQDPMTALNPVLTIGQQLAEAAGTRSKARLEALLSEVEIAEPSTRLNHYPHQFSGGQKQRIVIAMALAGAPEVLIADEPTTALDVTTQAQLLDLLKKIQKERNMRLLLITHDLSLVKVFADRIYVMYAGQMVESATVSDFFKQPLHPYATHLIAALPHFNKRDVRLSAIPGRVPAPDDRPEGCHFHPRCAHCFERCQTVPPELNMQANSHAVRCHLYPAHEKPPALPAQKADKTSQHQIGPVLISVKHLSVHFPMKRASFRREAIVHKAVNNISFELKQGQTLALVGESGKS